MKIYEETRLDVLTDQSAVIRGVFSHDRRGGDFLAAHRDDHAFKRMLILSDCGQDFTQVGNDDPSADGQCCQAPNLQFGDVPLLKSDPVHGVHLLDAHLVEDGAMAGQWMLFCPLVHRQVPGRARAA